MMIPQKIHYFWFGRGEKSALEQECIARFARYAPGAEIIEWNEDNFDVEAHPYSAKAYRDRKWAFVSDYARLKVLYDQGGIYLDTDMYLVRDLTPLFTGDSFIGKEDSIYLNAAILGGIPGDPFIKDVLTKYDSLSERMTIPRVLTEVYDAQKHTIQVYDSHYFYPFSQDTIGLFDKKMPPEDAYSVHMWNYSWGNPILKKIKKFVLYKQLVSLLNRLGLKKIFKKVFAIE
jgi:Glycosyltransferase sugar-binding region containing DXD motif